LRRSRNKAIKKGHKTNEIEKGGKTEEIERNVKICFGRIFLSRSVWASSTL